MFVLLNNTMCWTMFRVVVVVVISFQKGARWKVQIQISIILTVTYS